LEKGLWIRAYQVTIPEIKISGIPGDIRHNILLEASMSDCFMNKVLKLGYKVSFDLMGFLVAQHNTTFLA
jgi:hypothetical protein